MDDLYALEGDGAGAWQRKHKRRKAREAAAKIRAQVRAEAKADFAKRMKKYRARLKAAKDAGVTGKKLPRRPNTWSKRLCVNISGQKFGRLTAIRIAPPSKSQGRNRRWWVKCDCGSAERLVAATNLRQGIVLSCGCLRIETVRENWRSGKLAAMRAARVKLRTSPLSLQIADLRHRILHKQRMTRSDAKLLHIVWTAAVEDEVRCGVRRRGKSGRAQLVRKQSNAETLH